MFRFYMSVSVGAAILRMYKSTTVHRFKLSAGQNIEPLTLVT